MIGTRATAKAATLLLALLMLAGCGQDEQLLAKAGTYVLEKDEWVATLELKPDGTFTFERAYPQGGADTEEGDWRVGIDRLDRDKKAIGLNPSPPGITRLILSEEGDLVEFTSDDTYVKQ